MIYFLWRLDFSLLSISVDCQKSDARQSFPHTFQGEVLQHKQVNFYSCENERIRAEKQPDALVAFYLNPIIPRARGPLRFD